MLLGQTKHSGISIMLIKKTKQKNKQQCAATIRQHSQHLDPEAWDVLHSHSDTYLWQAEGNCPRVNSGMRLQGKHIIVA